MVSFLSVLYYIRKAKKKPLVGLLITEAMLNEVGRNAAAYGWEIGRGAPLAAELDSTVGNPFLYELPKDLV